jgi:hypothetical protein
MAMDSIQVRSGEPQATALRFCDQQGPQVHGLIAKARADKLIVKKDGGYALKK